jgi:methionine sulfoxide reductase heme-binding subunit
MTDIKFNKVLILLNGAVPLLFFVWDFSNGTVGPNPVEFFLRTTGTLGLITLLVTLLLTPLRKIFGWNGLIKYRRMLGLYAFFYICLHFIAYIVFDRSLSLTGAAADIFQRPFVAIGMVSFFLLIPLAITSTNNMIKRLGGKRWAELHKATYYVAVGGVIHFYLIVKSDIFYPLIFGLILIILLGYRVYANKPKIQTLRAG